MKMPNHTDNRVILSHDDTQMIDMIYNIMNTEDTPLCQTLIPMPEELEGTSGFDENGASGWYAWRCDNWGTKWDIYEAHCDRMDANTLVLAFFTAWSPPFPIYDKLTDMGFEVTARYLDEGWMYIGEYNSDGDHVHFDNVEDVVTEYEELDYEFGISEEIESMKESA
jgi:hypothetical protein